MKQNSKTNSELNELGIHIPKISMPDMTLPQDYFESFSTEIMSRIKHEDFIGTLPKEMPFDTPQDFFADFGKELFQSLHKHENHDFIDSLPKSLPYAIPNNYFEELPSQVLSKLVSNQGQLVPSFSRKLIAKLSLAATILLFMGIAYKGFILNANQASVVVCTENELAKISDNDIDQYINSHQTEMDASLALENIDESNIDLKQFETEVFENVLNHISDEEILNYTF